VVDLGYAQLDTDRARRTGDPEVVLGTGKTADQVVQILRSLSTAHPERAVLATRLEPVALAAVADRLPAARCDAVARAATLGPTNGEQPEPRGTVSIVSAGTSDLPVAREAALTAEVFGAGVRLVSDVGVAGLHRVLEVRDALADADCLIVVAGMEGALPSVVGGLVGVPLVAVPTSVGYGASFGGVAALLGMLNSCAPGVTVVNIDNGFGAGVFAARVARAAGGRISRHSGGQDHHDVTTTDKTARVGWVDAGAGVSGDMLLGALVDAGVPLDVMQSAVDAVSPEPVRLRAEETRRGELRALRVHVDGTDTNAAHTHRPWADIRTLLERAALDDAVRARAISVFSRLADAEATAHGVDPGDVAFHEVGALDAIADVVGACAGLHHLGLDRLVSSSVAVGGGSVDTAHGRLPVPVPAVAALLTGVPTTGGPVDNELATPTGAALVVGSVDSYGRQPAMTVERVGGGAGRRDPFGHANVVRLLTGTAEDTAPRQRPPGPSPSDTRPLLLQTNVDDLDPRLWPHVLSRILDAGASDAWLTPILMKKGRPAHTLSVLVRPELRDAVETVVFTETSTIGLRVQSVDKVALDRSELVVQLDGHPVRVKAAARDGAVLNLQPEYDDVVAIARATDRPVKAVLAEATALARSVEA